MSERDIRFDRGSPEFKRISDEYCAALEAEDDERLEAARAAMDELMARSGVPKQAPVEIREWERRARLEWERRTRLSVEEA